MKIRPLRPKLLCVAAAALLAVSAAGCASTSSSGSEGEQTTIRYQTNAGLIDLPELADALGYLDGLTLERVGDVQGGPESLRAVATDQVDYGGAFNGAIAKLASTGAPITAVISYYGSSGDVNSSLLVKRDSGIQGARDLIGKKVAVNTLGANAEAVLDTYLAEEGLSPEEIDQVTLVPLPGINSEAALREGQVDAAYMFGSLKEVALSHGGLKALVTDVELVGPYNGGSYVLRDDFIAENPETTRKFVGAIARALRYSQNHSVDEVRELMKGYLDDHGRGDFAEALDLWEGTGVPSSGGVIGEEDFTLWLDWLEAEGEVDAGSVEPSEIYTNEYNPYAKEAQR
jgi:ABC-type nitrate/sulfonate/bicarbonate transport system substrate-binding protein